MVFGNFGDDSGTGVCFSRDPSTGENAFYGEYLMNAQGEDVVAGIRTPEPIDKLANENKEVYDQLVAYRDNLEKHYKDMQDMEFTIERGKLYMLQTRNGKRTASAALKIACDLVEEKMITIDEALLKIDPRQMDSLLHPAFDGNAIKAATPIAKGLPASPGAATGKIAFTAEEAVARVANGEKIILVRQETSPEDIEGMYAAEGILTARGGMTSHAAVVARGMGTCCVAGCQDIIVNEEEKTVKVDGKLTGGLNAAWYNYRGGKCAEITSAKLNAEFIVPSVSIPAKAEGNVGLDITGYIEIPTDGIYTFSLTSDDGSMLYIAGQEVISNDNPHSPREVIGQIALGKGLHSIRVLYFDNNGGMLKLQLVEIGDKYSDVPEGWYKH